MIHVKATIGSQKAEALPLADPTCQTRFGGELVRALLGLEQVGASGTPSDQTFLFDLFISRPVPRGGTTDRYFGRRLRWGDVRIGSYPQQVNTQLVSFGQNFATNVGNLKVNELVQKVEFSTGPEYRFAESHRAVVSILEPSINKTRQRSALTLFGSGGAVGPFGPANNATVFSVPATSSPQYMALTQLNQNRTVTTQYVAFIPPIRDRFFHHYEVGLRLYSFYAENNEDAMPLNTSPAIVDFSLGQNQLVTKGVLSGLAGHVSA